ncbi:BURP domain-containing protein 16-like [Cryptomeria japonica]|uniref:BURP domain-containing protein 16-like n=1 Tax=Cryptomeria japonica TaxID=3369 RepID=UPI0027DA57B5|nr:BURP domain-containing protein 16-like [Cryptomeria japonica]
MAMAMAMRPLEASSLLSIVAARASLRSHACAMRSEEDDTPQQSIQTDAIFIQSIRYHSLACMKKTAISLVGGVSSNVAELERQRWREKLPEVAMPETLVARLSPLSLTQLQYFAAGLKKMDATSFDAHQFCRSAGLICREDVIFRLERGSIFLGPPDEVEENVFVDKEELRESGEMILPDLSPSKYSISFFPTELAEMMPPFSSANVSQLVNLLNIPSESNMSRSMLETLKICEGSGVEGEVKRCSSSVEYMVEFVVSVLGSDIDLFTDPSVLGSGQRVTITKASKREDIVGVKPPVACHNLMFPYGVSYCHSIKGSEVFDLQLEVVQNGEKVRRNATAVCHYLSDGAGGNQAACHPVYGEMLLWTPKPTHD